MSEQFYAWDNPPVPNEADAIMALADAYSLRSGEDYRDDTYTEGGRQDQARAALRSAVEQIVRERDEARKEAEAFAKNLRGKQSTAGATYQHLVERAERAEQYAREERTCRLNLEMDVRRLAGWEKPINGFECLNELQAAHDAWMEKFQRAEQDAARYRWLREKGWNLMVKPDSEFDGAHIPSRLDAAIDALLEKKNVD